MYDPRVTGIVSSACRPVYVIETVNPFDREITKPIGGDVRRVQGYQRARIGDAQLPRSEGNEWVYCMKRYILPRSWGLYSTLRKFRILLSPQYMHSTIAPGEKRTNA